MKFRSALSTLLAIGMAAATPLGAVSPVFAADDDETQLGTDDSLYRTKTATLEDDGTYTIDIEAYAKGTPQTLVTSKGVPLDIVLVIDQSASMDKSLSLLKNAVYNFNKQVADSAKEDGITHRVAVVGFSTGEYVGLYGYEKFGGTGLFKDGSLIGWNDIQEEDYKSAFVNAYDSQQSDGVNQSLKNLTGKEGGFEAVGATKTDLGMELAENVLNANPVTEEGRKQVVIVFSDGTPTKWGGDLSNNNKDENRTVANNALKVSKRLKDKNIAVHSIAVGAGSDGEKFLNYLSSNYPDTTKYTKPGYKIENPVYYHEGKQNTDIENVFQEVQTEILKEVSKVKLDKNAVLQDVVAAGFDTSNMEVSAWTIDGTMQNAGKDNEKIIWNENSKSEAGLTVVGDKTSIATVTGFDYSEYFIYGDHSGKKLVVRLTGILPTENTAVNEQVLTNGENSGVFKNQADVNAANSGQAIRFFKFEKPDTILTNKAVVVDYAKPLEISAAKFVEAGTDEKVTAKVLRASTAFEKNTATSGTFQGNYGRFDFANEKLTYTPQTMQWDGADTLKVLTQTTNASVNSYVANGKYGNLWSTVKVLPANNIYYEDDFIVGNTDGVKIGITYKGAEKIENAYGNSEVEGFEQGGIHGSWAATEHAGNVSDSGATVHHMNTGATASFSFKGTGFDIYSRTNLKSGNVQVKITDANNVLVKAFTIDTKSASGIDDPEDERLKGQYYHVPTLSYMNLPYGQYNVVVTVKNTGIAKREDRHEFWLDGIRIYNPLNPETEAAVAGDAYEDEYGAKFVMVRDQLTAGSYFVDESLTEGTGLKIDYADSAISKMAPKNEVYLGNMHELSFALPAGNYDCVYIAMKSLDGKPVNVGFKDANGEYQNVLVNSTVDQYYAVPVAANGTITLRNSTSAEEAQNVLSLTKLRLTASSFVSGNSIIANDGEYEIKVENSKIVRELKKAAE